MPFLAYDLALQLVAELDAPIAELRKRSVDDADQLERAATSIVRNLAEGSGRFGKDRRHFYTIAYGSLRETKASMQLSVARGWLVELPPAFATAHRLGGILWSLTGR
jgi:four helix bundle protein